MLLERRAAGRLSFAGFLIYENQFLFMFGFQPPPRTHSLRRHELLDDAEYVEGLPQNITSTFLGGALSSLEVYPLALQRWF